MNAYNQNLLSQLRDFGLDPREWRLEIQSLTSAVAKVLVFNKSDHELILHGFADNHSWLVLSYQG